MVMCATSNAAAREDVSALHVNPMPYFSTGHSDCIPAAELRSFELFTDGAPSSGTPPVVAVEATIEIVLRMIPRVASPANHWIRIGIGDERFSVNNLFPLDPARWEIGIESEQRCALRVPAFTFVGRGVLTIAIQQDQGLTGQKARVREAILYRGPIDVPAVTTNSTVDAAAISSAMGTDFTRAGKAFRLAPHQSVSIPINADRAISGIALISAVPGDAILEDDEDALDVSVSLKSRASKLFTIKLGESISLANYDAFRPGTRSLSKGNRFSAYPYPYRSWKNEPLNAYAYLTQLPLGGIAHPIAISFQNVSESNMIDVYELVLVHGTGTP